MPVINKSVAPVIVIAPRARMARAIIDDDVVEDKALELKPAYKYGPGHQASAMEVNLVSHAQRVLARGGGRVEALKELKTRY